MIDRLVSAQPMSTLVMTVTAGILSLILGAKLKIPSILFFLFFGVLLGPEFLNIVRPGIFNSNFPYYISLMVALILFEGGSTLKFSQLRAISGPLRNLLSIGVLATLIGVTLAARAITGMSWERSILFGAIMVVTGPTVVLPILRRIRVKEKIHNLLKWEAILIDPLGVILAVVIFEFLILQHGTLWDSLLLFSGRLAFGIAAGLFTGFLMGFVLGHRKLLRSEGSELGGLFVLFLTVFSYGLSEIILTESGLVTVTVAGIYFGNRKFGFQKQIDHFKDQVVLFALSVLFVLLASNIPIRSALDTLKESVWLVLTMVFLIRPATVFLSAGMHKDLKTREKFFLSFMAPRGIVSASLASLFAFQLDQRFPEGRGVFLPLAFSVIAGTIVIYALFAGLIAKLTGVKEGKLTGVLIIGANRLGLLLAEEIRREGIVVKFIDSNPAHCFSARNAGFEVYQGSAFERDFIESLDIKGIGKVIAMTSNNEVNILACQTFADIVGRRAVFRLWAKTDDWKSVDASYYDDSWGRPVGVMSKKGDLLDGSPGFALENVELKKQMDIRRESMVSENYGIPFFGIVNGEVRFAAPGEKFPEKAKLFSIRGGLI